MNKVIFNLYEKYFANGNKKSFVEIIIDNKNFIEIVKEKETSFPECKEKDIAGKYSFIGNPERPISYFLGKESNDDYFKPKRRLLECDCGCLGCWPLLCKITIKKDFVIWSHFENDQRNRKNKLNPIWNYGKDFIFTFDITEYKPSLESALSVKKFEI